MSEFLVFFDSGLMYFLFWNHLSSGAYLDRHNRLSLAIFTVCTFCIFGFSDLCELYDNLWSVFLAFSALHSIFCFIHIYINICSILFFFCLGSVIFWVFLLHHFCFLVSIYHFCFFWYFFFALHLFLVAGCGFSGFDSDCFDCDFSGFVFYLQ